MKKIYLLILILSISLSVNAQTADQLIRLHNVIDYSAMNAISNPNEGALIYVSSSDEIYFHNGTSWNIIGAGGSPIVDTNDDAWGVTGQDIDSDISRKGKVTIGESGNTSIKLDINGQAVIRRLPSTDGNFRNAAHNENGVILSDKYTSIFRSDALYYSWLNVNYVNVGVTITGYYESNDGCTSGHFQFRYQFGQSPLYNLNYHSGNGVFNYNSTTGVYTIQGPSYTCGYNAASFRVDNNMLQIRRGSSSGLKVDLRVEAY